MMRLVYQVERTDYFDGRKKTFRQRRPDPARPGEWLWNITGVPLLLYRLPEVLAAKAHGRTIAIVEGEAKADLLWSWDIPATCSPMGAKNWRADLYAATLRGADVIILPDSDDLGRFYLEAVAVSLTEVGATVRVLALPGLGPKGDVIDWERAGGTREQLDALINSDARPWAPSERESVNTEPARPLKGEQGKPTFPVIAWPDISFDLEEEWRVEEVFPLVGLACLYGGPSTVKTFILLDLLVRMARGGFWGGREVKQCPVVYIAAEGSGGIKKRIAGIKKMHAEKGLPPDIPFFLIPAAPNLGTGVEDLGKLIKSVEALGIVPGAIAVDTTSRSLGGADENGPGMDQLVNNGTALANYFSCLVVLVHHTPLADDERLRGRTTLIGGLDVSIISKREKGSLVATLCVKKMRDEDDEQSFTVHLERIVLGHTKKGREVSTLVVKTVEPGSAEGAKQDKRKAAEILRDEFIAAYDRLADGAQKSLGLDLRSSVLKVPVEKVRDELKNRGLLEKNETGGLTDTARSQFQRAKAELVKTKGGKLVEKEGLIWRP
jgi:hypothetical protein